MILRDELTNDYIGIQCDRCGIVSPSVELLIQNGGLNNIGWDCRGGSHLCPEHARKARESDSSGN